MFKQVTKNVLVVLTISLVGCVTIEQKPFERKANAQRLVDVSVSAAARYVKAGEFDDAHRHLSKAIETDRRSPKVHNAYGLLYRVQGETELSEEHYKLALRYDSDYSKAHNNYGTLLYELERYKEAIKHLKRAAADPLYDRRAQSFENLGRCYLRTEQLKKAELAFNRAVRLDDRSARSYLELAQISFDRRQFADTAEYIKQFDAVARQTAQSFWLGIQAQRVLGDKNLLASYELGLRNLYPNSQEFQLFLQSQ